MNYTDAKNEFEHYLDGYDRNNDKVRLKIIHTYGARYGRNLPPHGFVPRRYRAGKDHCPAP